MENPIKMDDLGIPLFLETPIFTFLSILLLNTGFTEFPWDMEQWIYIWVFVWEVEIIGR